MLTAWISFPDLDGLILGVEGDSTCISEPRSVFAVIVTLPVHPADQSYYAVSFVSYAAVYRLCSVHHPNQRSGPHLLSQPQHM